MKKIIISSSVSFLVFAIITMTLVYQPVEAGPIDDNDHTPSTRLFECFHVVDGVVDPIPYAAGFPGRPCPPWGSTPGAAEIDSRIDSIKTSVGLPPHLCQEISRPVY